MKKILVVLLTLGLLAAFSTTVFAVDVKVSGEFYVAGMYLDRTSLQKDVGPSTAFYYQRLRIKTDFSIAPGLTLVTRFDALERSWGATRSTTQTAADSAGTRAENENIAIDWAYLEYQSPIGIFAAGYMNDGAAGTIFANNSAPGGRVRYSFIKGPLKINAVITKSMENSYSAVNTGSTWSDGDKDKYSLEEVFTWKTGKVGFNINYYNWADKRTSSNYRQKFFMATPYAIAQIGPVALQTEFNYIIGDQTYEAPASASQDIKIVQYSGWIDAVADLKTFYIGGTIAYVSGDDPGTPDKLEGYSTTLAVNSGGRDWQPCLIMWNFERIYWSGALTGFDSANQDTGMTNTWFFQARGGVRPVDALNIMATVSYANADKKPSATWLYNDYGYEVDLTATYKITNNLSYMLGGGYLFTGKYYKGTSDSNEIKDDFLLINKLTLTF